MNKFKNAFTNTTIGILFLLFFISLGLAVAIYCRPLYYMGMERISAETGYPIETIKENYDALIDYCSPFFTGELSFPSLPSSESGLSHFAEVKVIFNLFFVLLFLTPCCLTGLIFLQHKKHNHSWLFTSPIIMCVLPLLIGLACAVDFDRVFVLFHHIVFQNEDWLFYPSKDPIILFLPERFFLQCAVIIIAAVLLGAIILLALGRKQRKSQTSNHL